MHHLVISSHLGGVPKLEVIVPKQGLLLKVILDVSGVILLRLVGLTREGEDLLHMHRKDFALLQWHTVGEDSHVGSRRCPMGRRVSPEATGRAIPKACILLLRDIIVHQ